MAMMKRVMYGLTSLVALIVSLFAFSEIIDAVFDDLNTSTWFGSSTSVAPFITNIIPVFGIIAVFGTLYIVIKALQKIK